jgi:hypothetical protein
MEIAMAHPYILLRLVNAGAERERYGYQVIEVLAYNYDGKGGMLTLADGELKTWDGTDRDNILIGDPRDGTNWYQPDLPQS